jgi:hypothetical protein
MHKTHTTLDVHSKVHVAGQIAAVNIAPTFIKITPTSKLLPYKITPTLLLVLTTKKITVHVIGNIV